MSTETLAWVVAVTGWVTAFMYRGLYARAMTGWRLTLDEWEDAQDVLSPTTPG